MFSGRIRSVEFSLRSSEVIGVVRCTFHRGCNKESGMVSSSISTSIGFAFFTVSGGATVYTIFAIGAKLSAERPQLNSPILPRSVMIRIDM